MKELLKLKSGMMLQLGTENRESARRIQRQQQQQILAINLQEQGRTDDPSMGKESVNSRTPQSSCKGWNITTERGFGLSRCEV